MPRSTQESLKALQWMTPWRESGDRWTIRYRQEQLA